VKDVMLKPTENAHLFAKSEPVTLRFYGSGMFPEMVSMVTLVNGRVSEGTRLDLGQVIELQEALEEFISETVDHWEAGACETEEGQ
jgi:hypothetical protein